MTQRRTEYLCGCRIAGGSLEDLRIDRCRLHATAPGRRADAAPALLAACKLAVTFASGWEGENGADTTLNVLCAAIALAEGAAGDTAPLSAGRTCTQAL